MAGEIAAVGPDTGPDEERALRKYRRRASTYDLVVSWSSRSTRKRAVDLLGLTGGEAVLDVACGTGLSFDRIQRSIGPEGQLIGLDMSPEMLARAQRRVQRAGWKNVTFVEAPAGEAGLPVPVDAVLFILTHDVMRSPEALNHLFRQVKPGARVVAAGAKLVGAWWWAAPANVIVQLISRGYVTTLEGLRRPWDHLERLVPNLQVRSVAAGTGYVAWGDLPAKPRA